jgi:exonuclease SbcC
MGKIKTSIDAVRSSIESLTRTLGSLQEQEKNKKKAEKEIGEFTSRLTALNNEIQIYDDLIKAFSRKGIPSLIINNSLPLIETEANRLLSKFGGGLKIEFTRRPDKNETLEILISKMGKYRKVSTFSGGQVIQIALAIRIALSRLLMLRSNAKIELLIIDEPVGLDKQRLQNLVECLHTLSSEFSQILVISHLDSLINAFNNTLFVSLDPVKGSKIIVK